MKENKFTFDSKYKFTEGWFDHNIPLWNELFTKYIFPIKNVLEIGCYEGRATVYLCNEVLKSGTNYYVVDTFQGSKEESGMRSTTERIKNDVNTIENNFRHNITFHNDVKFYIHKGESQLILPEMYYKSSPEFDLIFIDASHRSDDTFVDAYYANKMLKQGGILIFDDFGWKDPSNPEIVSSPEFGIKSFNTLYKEEYEILHTGYQVVFRKKIEPNLK